MSSNRKSKAVIEEDGRFVIYNSQSTIVFETNTKGVGEYLSMQNDGNLVLYDEFNVSLWSSNTLSSDILFAYLTDDANLIIRDKHYLPRWAVRYSYIFLFNSLKKRFIYNQIV